MSFVRDEAYFNQGFFNQEKIREQMTNTRKNGMSENGSISAIKQEYRNVKNTPEYNKMFARNIPQERPLKDIVSLNILNNNNLSDAEKYKISKLYSLHGEKLFDLHKEYGMYNKTNQNLSHLPFEDVKQLHREMNARIENKRDIEKYYNNFQSITPKFFRIHSADSYQYIYGNADKGAPQKPPKGDKPPRLDISRGRSQPPKKKSGK